MCHRGLQSCVGTWARLGYTGFDAQLQRILSLHCTLYVRLCVHKHAYAIYRGLGACHMSSRPVLVIWEREITRAMPRYAQACRRLWCMPLVDLLNALSWAGWNGLPPTPDTFYLRCSYHLHSSHGFLSTWGVVMLKDKRKTAQKADSFSLQLRCKNMWRMMTYLRETSS